MDVEELNRNVLGRSWKSAMCCSWLCVEMGKNLNFETPCSGQNFRKMYVCQMNGPVAAKLDMLGYLREQKSPSLGNVIVVQSRRGFDESTKPNLTGSGRSPAAVTNVEVGAKGLGYG